MTPLRFSDRLTRDELDAALNALRSASSKSELKRLVTQLGADSHKMTARQSRRLRLAYEKRLQEIGSDDRI